MDVSFEPPDRAMANQPANRVRIRIELRAAAAELVRQGVSGALEHPDISGPRLAVMLELTDCRPFHRLGRGATDQQLAPSDTGPSPGATLELLFA
jgi:hypothetical protein